LQHGVGWGKSRSKAMQMTASCSSVKLNLRGDIAKCIGLVNTY